MSRFGVHVNGQGGGSSRTGTDDVERFSGNPDLNVARSVIDCERPAANSKPRHVIIPTGSPASLPELLGSLTPHRQVLDPGLFLSEYTPVQRRSNQSVSVLND